jgi:hypothetical protein
MAVFNQEKLQLNLLEDGDIMLKKYQMEKQKLYFLLETFGVELLLLVEVQMILIDMKDLVLLMD